MKAELVPDNGDLPILITKDLTVVGRRDYCDVIVDDPSISKRHCILVKTDGLLVIRDLGSTNGTKVKGQRVRWAALLPDDRISLGSYKFRVYLGPDDTPGPSELVEIRKARARANGSPGADLLDQAVAVKSPNSSVLGVTDDLLSQSMASDTRIGPEGKLPAMSPVDDIDLAFVNAKTPIDGQEAIYEID